MQSKRAIDTIDQQCRTLLQWLYYSAQFLSVINCRFDKRHMKMRRIRRCGKLVSRILRVFFIVTYVGVLPNLFSQYAKLGAMGGNSYINVLSSLQVVSVMIFAVFIFVVQTRNEMQILDVLNGFLRHFQRIEALNKTAKTQTIFKRKFLLIVLLKLATTVVGYFTEIPALLQVEQMFKNGWVHMNTISRLVGVYLWLGSMFVLDACVWGFLVIAMMYEEMSEFLRAMLTKMINLEEAGESQKLRMSNHKRMQLLCDCADIISDCDAMYAALYALTKRFQALFQWQIFYYIYYNFMVILLLFHNCFWIYLHTSYIDKLGLVMVMIKIGNLAIMLMVADLAVQRSQLPQLLCLDVVCSDIDPRWCMSVETFLNRRQTERLEITVLGFFQLNNEFILLILSAIVSYLFIIIQFSLTDQLTAGTNVTG